MFRTLPYRRSAGVALVNQASAVFVGHRVGVREASLVDGHEWQMPQGGVDEGEDPYKAALRELYEETNVSSVSLIATAPHWLSYDFPEEALGRWGGGYRGQTQKWFLLRFEGDESERLTLSTQRTGLNRRSSMPGVGSASSGCLISSYHSSGTSTNKWSLCLHLWQGRRSSDDFVATPDEMASRISGSSKRVESRCGQLRELRLSWSTIETATTWPALRESGRWRQAIFRPTDRASTAKGDHFPLSRNVRIPSLATVRSNSA